jgi:60S ribosome biogenesis protein Rrp14
VYYLHSTASISGIISSGGIRLLSSACSSRVTLRHLKQFLFPHSLHLMPTPAATLRASLEHHNSVFENLLKLIPAKHYLVRDPDEEARRFSFKFYIS